MATYLFKNKKYFIGLFLGLFFLPIFSSAVTNENYIPLGPECSPSIIGPVKVPKVPVTCPFCAITGGRLHLKWDLKTDFKKPVCFIACISPASENRVPCKNWPISGGKNFITNLDGSPRANTFGPKDDAFISPFVRQNLLDDGYNYFIDCYDQGGSGRKVSEEIKVYKDCEAPGVCEERAFPDIVNDLNNFRKTKITEKSAKGWAEVDPADVCYEGHCQGSGDITNLASLAKSNVDYYLNNFFRVLEIDPTDPSKEVQALPLLRRATDHISWGGKNFKKILESNKGDVFPVGLVAFSNQENGPFEVKVFFGVIIMQFIEKTSNRQVLIVESSSEGILPLLCEESSLGAFASILGIDPSYYSCIVDGGPDGYLMPFVFKPEGQNNLSRLMRSLKSNGYPSTESRPTVPGKPIIDNFGEDLSSSYKFKMRLPRLILKEPIDVELEVFKATLGIVDLKLKTAYLGEFDSQDRDCHPGGTFSKIEKRQKLLALISDSVSNFSWSQILNLLDKNK